MTGLWECTGDVHGHCAVGDLKPLTRVCEPNRQLILDGSSITELFEEHRSPRPAAGRIDDKVCPNRRCLACGAVGDDGAGYPTVVAGRGQCHDFAAVENCDVRDSTNPPTDNIVQQWTARTIVAQRMA